MRGDRDRLILVALEVAIIACELVSALALLWLIWLLVSS